MDEYTIEDNGYTIVYYRNGRLHRDDGPAIFWKEKIDKYFYLIPDKEYTLVYKELTVEEDEMIAHLKKHADIDSVYYYLEGFRYEEKDYLNKELKKSLLMNETKIKKTKI